MSKQSLLLVDGDTRSLRVLEVSLRKAGFIVTPAASVDEANEVMKEALPDLIISETAVSSPTDGFVFRDQIRANSHYADIPFVFLTAETALENKIRGLELGADDYLTKPIYIKEIIARINILLHKRQRAEFAKHGEGVRFSGRLVDLPVVDVIQTLEVSRKSGVIQFVADQRRAAIYFRDGKVIDAEAGTLQGADAVYRLLTWTDGEFEVVFRTVRRRDVITASSQALLMEGMRRLDEWSRLVEELPSLSSRFALDTVTLADRLGDIPDENNPVLRLFDGKRTLLEVIEASSLGDLECLQAISRLHFEGLLLDPIPEGQASHPLPRIPESSGPVLSDIASTYAAASPFLPGALLPAGELPSAVAAESVPGNGVAMKLIEEAVSAAQADDLPAIEFISLSLDGKDNEDDPWPSLGTSPGTEEIDAVQPGSAGIIDVPPPPLPAAPLARVRLTTREVDRRIVNARATVERLRDRGGNRPSDEEPRRPSTAAESKPREPEDGTHASVLDPAEAPPFGAAPVRTAVSDGAADVDSGNIEPALDARVSPLPDEPEAAPGVVASPTEAVLDAGAVVGSGDAAGLKIIGSLGRERATAAGELIPTAPAETQPPERELVTIMPRRTTRGTAPVELAAVATRPSPPAEPKPPVVAPSTLRTSPVAGGVRRSANSRPLVLALIVLAACLVGVGVALTINWRTQAQDSDPSLAAGLPSGPPLPAVTGPNANPGLAGAHSAASVPTVDPGAAAGSPARAPGVGLGHEGMDAGILTVEVGHANIAADPDAGATKQRQDVGVDSVAEARRLYEKARAALDEGDAHKALALASASLKLRKTARTYLEYARALQRLGHVDEALEAVDSALQIVPTYAPSWSQRGMILWASRRREEARMAFHRYLDLDPNGRDAATVRQLLNQP